MPIAVPRPAFPSALALLGLLLAAGCSDDAGTRRLDAGGSADVGALPLDAGGSDDAGAPPPPTAKLLVFSDPHYFAPTLGTTGAAFTDYLANDRKLIAESDAIMRAMVSAVEAEDPDLVLVSGDLTKDGERLSHDAVAGYLRQMKGKGRKVFVVPGNHDIQNGAAESYAGDTATPVPTISAADFASIYQDAGFGVAIARDSGSLSYVAELVPGLWLLAIDSCIYGSERGSSETAGRIADGTRTWIKTMLAEAQRRGVRVLAMMHHGLVEHFAGQTVLFADFVVQDRAAVAQLLVQGGVGAVFTGHFHANDITQAVPDGQTRTIFDIETGSTVTAPCPYRIVELASDQLTITTKHVTTIDFPLGGTSDFQTLAHDDLRVGLDGLIARIVQSPPYSMSAARAATVSPWLADGLVAHYFGDEVMPAEVNGQLSDLLTSGSLLEQFTASMLQSIWTDLPPADNAVTLDLATSI